MRLDADEEEEPETPGKPVAGQPEQAEEAPTAQEHDAEHEAGRLD
jgi:hypothetical protein